MYQMRIGRPQAGDVVELAMDGLGTQCQTVVAPR